MDDEELIEAAAAAAAPGVRTLDFAPWAGLLLIPYDSLCPLVFGIPADSAPEYELDTDTWAELGFLPSPDDTTFEEIQARADGLGDDAYTVFVSFYYALAARIRAETGLPVLIHEFDSYQEQLALQASVPALHADLLRGLDVLVSLRVSDDRMAVVHRDHGGQVWATGWHGVVEPEPGVERWKSLGSNPAVIAGALPLGAAAVKLQVGRGPWVEPAAIDRGFWLCALDAPELTRTPQLIYHDAEGAEFAIEVPLDGPEVPALWPAQAPSTGRLVSYSRGHSYQLEADGWRAETTYYGPDLPFGQGMLDDPGLLVAQQLGVPEISVASRPVVGSVLGHRHGFELAAQDDVWAAVANCGTFAVTVQGTGTPPARLDLKSVAAP